MQITHFIFFVSQSLHETYFSIACASIFLCNTPIFANLQYNRKPLLPVSVLSPSSLQHTHFRCSLSLSLQHAHLCKLLISSFSFLNLSMRRISPQHVHLSLSATRPFLQIYSTIGSPSFPFRCSLSLCNSPIYANYPFHLFRFSISPECLFLHSMCTIGSPFFPFRCFLSATRPFMQITPFIFSASQSLQDTYFSRACVSIFLSLSTTRPQSDERGREDLMPSELAREKKWRRCPQCKFYVEILFTPPLFLYTLH